MSIVATIVDVICSFNEVFWLYQWVDLILHRRDISFWRDGKTRGNECIFYAIYLVTVFCMNRIALTSPYTMVLTLIQNFAIIFLFWRSDFFQNVAIVGTYFFSLFLYGNIAISISGMIGGENLIRVTTMEKGLPRVIYLLLGGALWFCTNNGLLSYFKKKNVSIKGTRYVALISVVGVIGSAFLGTMMVSSFNIHVNTTWYAFLAIILVLAFGCYFVIKQKEEQLQVTMLTTQAEMLEKNYMQVNEFYMANAKLYHDMNHHFDAIYHMLKNGEQEEALHYVESIRGTKNKTKIEVHTGINVLDAILCEMDKKARKKEVTFDVETPLLPTNIGIENRDICSLFGNLLENAIEAASERVELKIKKVNQTLFITVKNDYSVAPRRENGRLMTSKKQKNLHGWGTQIIEQVVEKYDGSIEYETNGEFFIAYVMLCERKEG